MRKTLFLAYIKPMLSALLLLICVHSAFATIQTVAVLPSEGVLNPNELEYLTNKAQEIAVRVLPRNTFEVFPRDVIIRRLGGVENYLKECREAACIVDLGKKAQVDYVSQCSFGKFGSDFTVTFELYKVSTSALVDKFSERTRNINGLLSVMEKRIPEGFLKIPGASPEIKAPPPPPPEPSPAALPPAQYAAAGGNYVAQVVTEPAGAALSVNGMAYQGCPKTPCAISLYENRFKLSAVLSEHEPKDTAIAITMPNQLVKIILKPTTYYVDFATDPPGAKLVLDGKPACPQTPCGMRFKKGNVQVSASKELCESLDTTVFVSRDNRSFNIKLKPKFGTLEIKGGAGWHLTVGDKRIDEHVPLGSIRLLPGAYDAKLFHEDFEDIDFRVEIAKGEHKAFELFHEDYEDIDFSVEIAKGEHKTFDISDKKVNRFGILDIKPAYADGIGKSEKWRLTAEGEYATLGEVGRIKLLPGEHEFMLTHSCYDDIKLNAKIERGIRTNFNISDKLVLKQSGLILKAQRKGRNISKQIFVNGEQVETPFEGSVPLCSDIAIREEEWKRIDAGLKHNERVEYTYMDGTAGSHVLGAALDVAGAVFFVLSYNSFKDRDKTYNAYANSEKTGLNAYDGDWKKIKDYHSRGNAFLIAGSALLALGIGVHVWF